MMYGVHSSNCTKDTTTLSPTVDTLMPAVLLDVICCIVQHIGDTLHVLFTDVHERNLSSRGT